jgi:alpha-ketoglutarate-dependent taurine dioxygenase
MTLATKQLYPIGVEIVDADIGMLLQDEAAPSEIMELLDANGVVLFRRIGMDDPQQLAFSKRLGTVSLRDKTGWSKEYPGMYTIAYSPEANDAIYVTGTFYWHMDGTASLEVPHRASIISARVVSGEGGDTQFASTYLGYEALSQEEKERLEGLKCWHSVAAAVRRVENDRPAHVVERLETQEPNLHPLVWTHRNGRRSLVIGETASHVDGMPAEESDALLEHLLEVTTDSSRVYSHAWEVGDLVIWDNTGLLHRAIPYGKDSPREMHRVTLDGEEPIQ